MMGNTLRSGRGLRSALGRGFTLVELVLALAILGLTLTTLLFMRIEAVQKVTAIVEERELRRIAQEILEQKMAEFMSNEEEELAGDLEGRPGWHWEWFEPTDPRNVIQEGEEILLACTVRLYYPNPDDPDGEEQTYELTSWIMPSEETLAYVKEQQELLYEEGGMMPYDGYEGYGGYDGY